MVWLKDNAPINNSRYSIKNTAPPGIDVVTSTLTIDGVTNDDEGIFSCYCHLNESMVTSDEPVLSGISNIHLQIGKGGGGTHVWNLITKVHNAKKIISRGHVLTRVSVVLPSYVSLTPLMVSYTSKHQGESKLQWVSVVHSV